MEFLFANFEKLKINTAMKNLIYSCLFVLSLMFAYSCGSDSNNPIVPVTPTPTHQDSIVKLYTPSDYQHFNTGDLVCFQWSKSFYSSYRFYTDLDSSFNSNQYLLVNDTSSCETWIDTTSATLFWKVIPYLNDTIRYEYSSETRKFTVN